jgi:hypothetical protein
MVMMNYIDQLAKAIYDEGNSSGAMDDVEWSLYRMYAVLALAKGHEVTPRDVHDAWAAWATEHRFQTKNIIPFDDLSPDVQHMDDRYVNDIHAVVGRIR